MSFAVALYVAGLHPTVAWAVARAGGITAGCVVCDPMCGRAVVLVEAARQWPAATYVGECVS
jgi:23S rRNA G2445 N2-methylase RlmL